MLLHCAVSASPETADREYPRQLRNAAELGRAGRDSLNEGVPFSESR